MFGKKKKLIKNVHWFLEGEGVSINFMEWIDNLKKKLFSKQRDSLIFFSTINFSLAKIRE